MPWGVLSPTYTPSGDGVLANMGKGSLTPGPSLIKDINTLGRILGEKEVTPEMLDFYTKKRAMTGVSINNMSNEQLAKFLNEWAEYRASKGAANVQKVFPHK